MEERDLANEIDELRKDIAEIKELVKPQKKPYTTIRSQIAGPEIDELKQFANETGNESGVVSYHGFFRSINPEETCESNWGTAHRLVNELMAMPSDKISVVLSSLGNQQRWEILLALLNKPMSVAEIVEEFDMKTSGKAYHHLNNLIAADLLEEVKEKKYAVKGHRVQGIIMIMAGVSDLIDAYYSNGEWNAE